jgi:hypothetical protein
LNAKPGGALTIILLMMVLIPRDGLRSNSGRLLTNGIGSKNHLLIDGIYQSWRDEEEGGT